jgi:oligoendopeptidase F
MYQAVFDQIEMARDILRTKAGFFDRSGIWFFEREAPLPLEVSATYTWPAATELVSTAFSAVYPDLADHFARMLTDRWIESEARPAKRPGAFCTSSTLIDQQRVFMTFNHTLGDVSTLAHEVGHAWHSRLMQGMRPLARRYPMTLAETASIFAEHILMAGLLKDTTINDQQKLLLLDAELTDAAVFLLDITTRFEFEKKLYDMRQAGELAVTQLKELMCQTQQTVYGSALLADGSDPYFWASKLHFYITGVTFYNFPYTFGYLLARALINRFNHEGTSFLKCYEDFLRHSGSATVEHVARQTLGVDVSASAFWKEAIDSLQSPLESYRKNVDRYKSKSERWKSAPSK